MKNVKKLAVVVAGGAVGAGLGYVAYQKFAGNKGEGDTALDDRSTLEVEGDALVTDPENAFVPGGIKADEDTDPV